MVTVWKVDTQVQRLTTQTRQRSDEKVTVWKVDTQAWDVREVECPSGATWPKRDAEGDTICVNTHYDNREAAIRQLVAQAEAGIHLSAGAVERAQRAVERAREEAANAVVAATKAHRVASALADDDAKPTKEES